MRKVNLGVKETMVWQKLSVATNLRTIVGTELITVNFRLSLETINTTRCKPHIRPMIGIEVSSE